MLASRRFSFHRPTISSGNVLDYQDPVTIEITTALNNTNQANVITYTIDTNLTTEPKFFYEITGNVSATDFTDATPLYGSVTLDADGNATITKDVQGLGIANVDFVLNLRTGHPQTQIRATSNTIEYIDVPTISATGGTVTANVNQFYKLHEFNANADLVVSNLGDTANFSLLADVEHLIVGGGGGGGNGKHTEVNGEAATNPPGGTTARSYGFVGGGGAGANVISGTTIVTLNSYPAVIGQGGLPNSFFYGPNSDILQGRFSSSSSMFGATAPGGGNGGTYPGYDTMEYQNPYDAHNTGGAATGVLGNAINSIDYANVSTRNTSVAVNNDGGSGFVTQTSIYYQDFISQGPRTWPGGAGTGAGDLTDGAFFGRGVTSNITGSNVMYGTGATAGAGWTFTGVSGGTTTADVNEPNEPSENGGRGAGVWTGSGYTDATSGTQNTGSGGGGGATSITLSSSSQNGAQGADGVVLVRYIEHFRKANIL